VKTYIPELNRLVRSILIKSSHQATMINKHIIKTYGSSAVLDDISTWRYYLNLNGQYHVTNEQMLIYVLELNEVKPLTKELLETYKKTKADLETYTDTFINLIKQYPTNELLIRGMIKPIDIETAYNTVDGKILHYSDLYIEPSELDVINKLSKYTEAVYYRWFNDMYIEVSNYYVATFLAFLYSTLSIKIDSIRLENIHTHRVCKHHLDHFFQSNLNIDTTFMNHKSKLWLYQNLRTAMINVGKDETLEQIIDNVLTPNGIGVGKLLLKKTKPDLFIENINKSDKPSIDIDRVTQLVVEPKNNLYYSDGLTVSEVISMEVANDYVHDSVYDDINSLVNTVTSKLRDNNEINSDTKVLHLLGKEDRDILPFPRVNMVLDTLFYMSLNSNNDYIVTYLDENTNITYSITFNQAIRLLGFYLLSLGGIDSTSFTIASNAIVKKEYVDVMNLMLDDYTDKEYISILNEYRPTLFDVNFNTDYTVEYINDGIKYFIVDWVIKSSLTNHVSIGNMLTWDKYNHNEVFTIDVGDIIIETGINIPTNYDYIMSIKSLINSLTNGKITLDLSAINYDSINTYIDLMKKTTSYNLQILGSTIVGDSINVFDVNMGLVRGKTITTIKSSFVNGFENLICDPESVDLSSIYTFRRNKNMSYTPAMLMDSIGYGLSTPNTLLTKPLLLGVKDSVEVISNTINGNDSLTESNLTLNEGLGMDGNRTILLQPNTTIVDMGDHNLYGGVKIIYDLEIGVKE
jgi:hypothetical protein